MATILTANGITFNDSTQLNSKYGIFSQSTVTLFFETTAPVGWAQTTTHNNKALRVVSGTGGGSGGTTIFTTAFASQPITQTITATGTVNNAALAVAQIPSHTHPNSLSQGGAHTHGYNTVTSSSPNGAVPGSQVTFNSSPPKSQVATTDAGNHGHALSITAVGSSPALHAHPWSGTGPLSTSLNFSVQYIDIILCSFT